MEHQLFFLSNILQHERFYETSHVPAHMADQIFLSFFGYEKYVNNIPFVVGAYGVRLYNIVNVYIKYVEIINPSLICLNSRFVRDLYYGQISQSTRRQMIQDREENERKQLLYDEETEFLKCTEIITLIFSVVLNRHGLLPIDNFDVCHRECLEMCYMNDYYKILKLEEEEFKTQQCTMKSILLLERDCKATRKSIEYAEYCTLVQLAYHRDKCQLQCIETQYIIERCNILHAEEVEFFKLDPQIYYAHELSNKICDFELQYMIKRTTILDMEEHDFQCCVNIRSFLRNHTKCRRMVEEDEHYKYDRILLFESIFYRYWVGKLEDEFESNYNASLKKILSKETTEFNQIKLLYTSNYTTLHKIIETEQIDRCNLEWKYGRNIIKFDEKCEFVKIDRQTCNDLNYKFIVFANKWQRTRKSLVDDEMYDFNEILSYRDRSCYERHEIESQWKKTRQTILNEEHNNFGNILYYANSQHRERYIYVGICMTERQEIIYNEQRAFKVIARLAKHNKECIYVRQYLVTRQFAELFFAEQYCRRKLEFEYLHDIICTEEYHEWQCIDISFNVHVRSQIEYKVFAMTKMHTNIQNCILQEEHQDFTQIICLQDKCKHLIPRFVENMFFEQYDRLISEFQEINSFIRMSEEFEFTNVLTQIKNDHVYKTILLTDEYAHTRSIIIDDEITMRNEIEITRRNEIERSIIMSEENNMFNILFRQATHVILCYRERAKILSKEKITFLQMIDIQYMQLLWIIIIDEIIEFDEICDSFNSPKCIYYRCCHNSRTKIVRDEEYEFNTFNCAVTELCTRNQILGTETKERLQIKCYFFECCEQNFRKKIKLFECIGFNTFNCAVTELCTRNQILGTETKEQIQIKCYFFECCEQNFRKKIKLFECIEFNTFNCAVTELCTRNQILGTETKERLRIKCDEEYEFNTFNCAVTELCARIQILGTETKERVQIKCDFYKCHEQNFREQNILFECIEFNKIMCAHNVPEIDELRKSVWKIIPPEHEYRMLPSYFVGIGCLLHPVDNKTIKLFASLLHIFETRIPKEVTVPKHIESTILTDRRYVTTKESSSIDLPITLQLTHFNYIDVPINITIPTMDTILLGTINKYAGYSYCNAISLGVPTNVDDYIYTGNEIFLLTDSHVVSGKINYVLDKKWFLSDVPTYYGNSGSAYVCKANKNDIKNGYNYIAIALHFGKGQYYEQLYALGIVLYLRRDIDYKVTESISEYICPIKIPTMVELINNLQCSGSKHELECWDGVVYFYDKYIRMDMPGLRCDYKQRYYDMNLNQMLDLSIRSAQCCTSFKMHPQLFEIFCRLSNALSRFHHGFGDFSIGQNVGIRKPKTKMKETLHKFIGPSSVNFCHDIFWNFSVIAIRIFAEIRNNYLNVRDPCENDNVHLNFRIEDRCAGYNYSELFVGYVKEYHPDMTTNKDFTLLAERLTKHYPYRPLHLYVDIYDGDEIKQSTTGHKLQNPKDKRVRSIIDSFVNVCYYIDFDGMAKGLDFSTVVWKSKIDGTNVAIAATHHTQQKKMCEILVSREENLVVCEKMNIPIVFECVKYANKYVVRVDVSMTFEQQSNIVPCNILKIILPIDIQKNEIS